MPFDDSAIADVVAEDLATIELALPTAAALYADRDGCNLPGARAEIFEHTVELMTARVEDFAFEVACDGDAKLLTGGEKLSPSWYTVIVLFNPPSEARVGA